MCIIITPTQAVGFYSTDGERFLLSLDFFILFDRENNVLLSNSVIRISKCDSHMSKPSP